MTNLRKDFLRIATVYFSILLPSSLALSKCIEILQQIKAFHPKITAFEAQEKINPINRFYSRKNKQSNIIEIEIKALTPIHPIPNPYRRKTHTHPDNENISYNELSNKIKEEGFDLSFPIQVALMRNGELRIIGGHHRVDIMKKNGEKTIPAEIIIWDDLSPEVRKIYKETFIDFYSKKYPEYYKSLEENPNHFY